MKYDAIVFDLDDTLIDTKRRHYQVIKNYIKLHNFSYRISYENYCTIRKANRFTNLDLIRYLFNDKLLINQFQTFWNDQIESPNLLSLDSLIVDYSLLKEISYYKDMYIISIRANHTNAIQQIQWFNFNSIFQNIYFCNYEKVNPKTRNLIELKKKYNSLVFLGDSELDKQAAIEASVDFALVKTGIYTVDYNPSFNNINEFLKQLVDKKSRKLID